MDNVVTVYHGGIVETDQFSNVTFVGMESVSLMFDTRPLFSELIARAREELDWNSTDDDIAVVGVLHYGKSGRVFSRQVRIASEVGWDRYVNIVMKNEIQCLDLVMWKVSKDPTPLVCPPRNDQPTPHVLSPEGGNSAPADLSLPNNQIDDDDGVRVPDVQSGPNQTGIVLDVGISPQEIPTSQNHPSKSLW